MSVNTFHSFAQNGEDVVLSRVFGGLPVGRYVDVGANDPEHFSISYEFYRRGWHGITVEPVATYAEALRTRRPRDLVVEAAVSDTDATSVTFHEIADTGLSTLDPEIAEGHRKAGFAVTEREVPTRRLGDVLEQAGWDGEDIHFMTVDVEGAERDVLASLDLRRWRPRVVVVEATRPLTTEPAFADWDTVLTDADYRFTLFDGLSRFYVAAEHAASYAPALSYPRCSLDDYDTESDRAREQVRQELLAEIARLGEQAERVRVELTEDAEQARAELRRWRTTALTAWSKAIGTTGPYSQNSEIGQLRAELDAMRATVSWRVTRPIRTVRTRLGALR